LYGVMAFAVAQRTKEFGVRIALGAQTGDILKLVFAEGMALAMAGLLAGIVLSLFLTRYMASLLFGITPNNALAFSSVAAVIALVVCIACLLPARSATKVDPMTALRTD